MSVTEAIREAIDQHISSRSADKEFRARLTASMERHQRILDRLSKASNLVGGDSALNVISHRQNAI